jgi:hypothetical protein
VGPDRTFIIKAEDENYNILYQGKASGVKIESNRTTENVSVSIYPFVPVLSEPQDGALLDPNAFRLQWEALDNAYQYLAQVSENPAFDALTIDETVSGTTYTPTTLAASTQYYWRISAVDAYVDIGRPSEVRSFTTSACTYTISSDSGTFNIEGGDGDFAVTASEDDCTFLATASDEWITLTEDADAIGSGSGTISYAVSANEDAAGRIGTIFIGGEAHTITQTGTDNLCAFELEPEEVTVEAMGSNNEVQVTAIAEDCPWSAVSDADWVTITDGDSGIGNGVISYTVAPNTEITARVSTITVGGQIHTINQSASDDCIRDIFFSDQEFGYLGGDGGINITASTEDCPWTAVSNVDWIYFDNGINTIEGTGSDSVIFHVTRNDTTVSRSGTITVNGQEYTINQTELLVECTYQIEPLSGSFDIEGGAGQFNVIAPDDCSWSATPSDPAWILVTSVADGNGNGTVSYQVQPNDDFDSRVGTITIQPDGPSHTITQEGILLGLLI